MLINNSIDYSRADIIRALIEVGLLPGDAIFSHANMGFFGRLEGAEKKEDLYRIFKAAIFEVLGPKGTLGVPTFSYSFCRGENYDLKKTPSVCGMFSEMVLQDPDALRSEDANFSVAAIGANTQFLTQKCPSHSFGPDSFWDKFLSIGGKICNFNFDAGSTFIHYVEKKLKVPYRFDKAFAGTSMVNGQAVQKSFIHFVYDHNKPEDRWNFARLDKVAKQTGIARTADLGKGQIVLIAAADIEKLIREQIDIDPQFLRMGTG